MTRGKRSHTRAVKGIDGDVKLNRALGNGGRTRAELMPPLPDNTHQAPLSDRPKTIPAAAPSLTTTSAPGARTFFIVPVNAACSLSPLRATAVTL